MSVIGTNIGAMRASNASATANASLQQSMERLSTGKRINSAKDDAAGMAIASSMTSQIRGMGQAIRNANDGIGLAQTADGALSEVTNMLQRVRELSVQSASGTYSESDRANLQAEVTQLSDQIVSTLQDTKFNGVSLFDTAKANSSASFGTAGGGTKTTIQVGSESSQTVDINVANLATTFEHKTEKGKLTDALTADPETDTFHKVSADDFAAKAIVGGTTVTEDMIGQSIKEQSGDKWFVTDSTNGQEFTGDLTLKSQFNVGTADSARTTMGSVDTMMTNVNSVRAGLGAAQSRLTSAVNNLTSNVENLSSARSAIEDTDYSVETQALAKAQILSQASTAMLAQANQSQQGVLELLR